MRTAISAQRALDRCRPCSVLPPLMLRLPRKGLARGYPSRAEMSSASPERRPEIERPTSGRSGPSYARKRVGAFPVGRGPRSGEGSARRHRRLTLGSWQGAIGGPVRASAHQPLGARLRESRAAVATRSSTSVSRSNSCANETWSARATATSEDSVGLLRPASRSCQCFADSSADSAAASCVNSRPARSSRIRAPIRFAVAST